MKNLELSEKEASWLDEALYELKGLRGWAWDGDDLASYEYIVSLLDE